MKNNKNIVVTERTATSIKKLVKKMNDSLYRLEKADLTHESQFYQTLERYAVSGAAPFFNVDLATGKFRLSSDISRFNTVTDVYMYKQLLEQMKDAKTRTVRGTNAAIDKAYDTFMKSPTHLKNNQDLTFNQYREAFKIWRTQLEADQKSHFSSDTMMDFLESTNIYEITPDQMAEALRYGAEHTEKQLLKYYFAHPKGAARYQYTGRKSYTPMTKKDVKASKYMGSKKGRKK